MIENIQQNCEILHSLACAYFFFDGRDSQQNLQSHNSLIKSLLSQLSSKCPQLPHVLTELYKKCNDGRQEPSIEALENALLTVAEGFSHTYIIIDALDECTERPKALKWLESILRSTCGRIHVVVMSRQERVIQDRFKVLCAERISVADDPANRDIDIYLDQVFSTDEYLSSWDQATREFIRASLKDGAQGMYVSLLHINLLFSH